MKYIQKNPEPKNLSVWKTKKAEEFGETSRDSETAKRIWRQFRRNVKLKREIYDSLLQEQGFICCYCQRRIHRENSETTPDPLSAPSHIEHFQPKSIEPDRILDYSNLLVSCDGKQSNLEEETEIENKSMHCGHKKDEWYDEKLIISPLDRNCENYFYYTEDGQILAVEESDRKVAAETTINRLRLDIDKLREIRKKAIEDILDNVLDPDRLNPEQIKALVRGFSQTNEKGEYSEFFGAIVYILKQYLNIIKETE